MLTVVCVTFVLAGNVWLTFSRRKWLRSVCVECVLLYRTCIEHERAVGRLLSGVWGRVAYVRHLQRAAAEFPLVPTVGPAGFEDMGVGCGRGARWQHSPVDITSDGVHVSLHFKRAGVACHRRCTHKPQPLHRALQHVGGKMLAESEEVDESR